MSSYTDALDLPAGEVAALADAYLGYAATLEGQARTEGEAERLLPWRASCAALSALFVALVEPPEAPARFAVAARFYRLLDNDFWRVLAVCAAGRGLEEGVAEPVAPADDAGTLFYDLLVQALLSARRLTRTHPLYNLLEQARGRRLRAQPVGRLGLPLGLYADAVADSLEWDSPQPVVQHVATLLERAAEPVRAAQADAYHWRGLRGTVVPLEPEVLAACVALGARWFAARHPPGALAARMENLDATARVPLEVALALLIP